MAAIVQAFTDENKNVDSEIIQALLDDERMPCDADGNPKLDRFPFQVRDLDTSPPFSRLLSPSLTFSLDRFPVQVLNVPPDPHAANAIHRIGLPSQLDSTDTAWRARLASRFPSSWAAGTIPTPTQRQSTSYHTSEPPASPRL